MKKNILMIALSAILTILGNFAHAKDPEYFTKDENLKMSLANGVLTVAMDTKGESLVYQTLRATEGHR